MSEKSDLPPASKVVIEGEEDKPIITQPPDATAPAAEETPPVTDQAPTAPVASPKPKETPPVTDQAPAPAASSPAPVAKKKTVRRRGWTPLHELYETEE
jgi:hypothetical protein